VVDDNSVVVPLGGRSVADVDLGGDLPFGLVYPPDVDDDVLVVRPVLLVLPSDGRLAVQRRVAGPLEVHLASNEGEQLVEVLAVVGLDVAAREFNGRGHAVPSLGGSRAERSNVPFRALADRRAGPALLHCTAGKDRTGSAMMMLLDAIGVKRSCIVADYVAGSDEIAAVFERLISLPSYGERIAAIPAEAKNTEPETAERYLAALDEQFGGIRHWLRDAGLDDDELVTLRDRLTEPDR
jgi:hypothetical protein